jgi:hypothetical protein
MDKENVVHNGALFSNKNNEVTSFSKKLDGTGDYPVKQN